jgi:hypothetical protein
MGHSNYYSTQSGKDVTDAFEQVQEYYDNYENKYVGGRLVNQTHLFNSVGRDEYNDRFDRLSSPSPIWYRIVKNLDNGRKEYEFQWWMRD